MGRDGGQMGGLLTLGGLRRPHKRISTDPKLSKALLGPCSWVLRRKTPETDRKASFSLLPPKKLRLSEPEVNQQGDTDPHP